MIPCLLGGAVFILLACHSDSPGTKANPKQPVEGNDHWLCTPANSVLLPPEVHETSGLCWISGSLWTHNDSGGDALLFQLDPETGEILHKTVLQGIRNIDWEDIFFDGTSFYIADIGNNDGMRDTLFLYRFPANLLPLDNVPANRIELLSFSYEHYRNLGPEMYDTPFDAEAFLVLDDSVIIFTKDWVRNGTTLYSFANTPGHHTAKRGNRFACNGLVTGAAYDPEKGNVILAGYNNYIPVVWAFHKTGLKQKNSREWSRRTCNDSYGLQTEGIAVGTDGFLYISAESSRVPASLFKYQLSDISINFADYDHSPR